MAQLKPPVDPTCPTFSFTKLQVDNYDIPYETHVSNQPEAEFKYKFVASGAIVIDSHPTPSTSSDNSTSTSPQVLEPKVLLIQRAAHDSWPNRWEIPGGACDPEDPSILYSVARELWEEAGLKATQIGPLVGDTNHVFLTSSGNLVCKLSFLVDVERGRTDDDSEVRKLEVKLDPKEHQAYVWATEYEVKVGWVGELELRFTEKQVMDVVLEAFKVKKEIDEKEAKGRANAMTATFS